MIECPNCHHLFTVIEEMNEEGTILVDLDSPINPYQIGEKMKDVECPLCEQEFDILKISADKWQSIIINTMPISE